MSDKRAVSTDALETLGTIIKGGGRDAIHLAVEPVIAGERLCPGEDIGIKNGKAYHETDKYFAHCDKYVGIVDPFLKQDVMPGEMFWLVVYPRQITSLRHVWSHPDFDEAVVKEEEIEIQKAEDLSELQKSIDWITNWALTIPLAYDVVMQGADEMVEALKNGGYGEYLCFGGLLEGEYVPDEFWPHYETVKGIKVEGRHRQSFFTCSC